MRYRVFVTEHVDYEVEVEADSEAEAITAAYDAHSDGLSVEVDSGIDRVEVA